MRTDGKQCQSCRSQSSILVTKRGQLLCTVCIRVSDVKEVEEAKEVTCLKCDRIFTGTRFHRICNVCKGCDERKYLAAVNNGIH